jgi:hypothetical protein
MDCESRSRGVEESRSGVFVVCREPLGIIRGASGAAAKVIKVIKVLNLRNKGTMITFGGGSEAQGA